MTYPESRFRMAKKLKLELRGLARVHFHQDLDSRLLIPPLALATMLLIFSDWVCFRLPLHPLASVVWIVAPLVMLALFWVQGGLVRTRASLWIVLLSILAAWFVLADVSGQLLPGIGIVSDRPDAWSYQTMADYFDHYRRGESMAGAPLLDQYASHLQNSRFGAAALLALLTQAPGMGGNNVAFAQVAFYFICLVVHFFALAYFVRGLSVRWQVTLAAALLATVGGWLSNVITVGNYDNLLFVSLLPAWLGLATRFLDRNVTSWRFVLGGALILGALFNIYPEGFVLFGLLTLPLTWQLLRDCTRERCRIIPLVGLVGLSSVFVLPYGPIFVSFLKNQVGASAAGLAARPGIGNFPGLLNSHAFPAIFALGEEGPGSSFSIANLLLPTLLCVLIGVGAWTVSRRHRWFLWVAPILFLLALWQGVLLRYDYGLYKILVCSSWWIYSAVAIGLDRLTSGWREHSRCRALGPVSFIVLFVAIAWEKGEDRVIHSHYSLGPLIELTQIDNVIGREVPILISLDNDFEYLWSTIFLRSHPLAIAEFRSYLGMPHIIPILKPRKAEECPYMLVAGLRPGAVWHNERFSLIATEGALIASIENPNGLETVEQQPFFWMSGAETHLTLLVTADGDYALRAHRFHPGPSAPESKSWRVEIDDATGRHTTVITFPGTEETPPAIPIHLLRGRNRVALRCLERPTVFDQPNGDKRELLLGVQGPYLVKTGNNPK